MSNEPMELAKNYDERKSPFPSLAQVKYDGVPLVFTKKRGGVVALTRQNECALSVRHLIDWVRPVLHDAPEGACIIAECLVHGLTFKESNGIIRRHTNDSRIIGIVFDGWLSSAENSYNYRFNEIRATLAAYFQKTGDQPLIPAPSFLVLDHTEAMEQWATFKRHYGKNIEGMMLHHTDKPFQPGKRCWGMARYKPQPTIDLEVISYEEAVSETGEPLGMVGRINVELARRSRAGEVSMSVIGVGPGRMTHDERRAVWQASYVEMENYEPYNMKDNGRVRYPTEDRATLGPIAEIKYMPDPSYDALRQPTFQRFRTDKEFPDVLEY